MSGEAISVIFSIGSFTIVLLLSIVRYLTKDKSEKIDKSIETLERQSKEQDKRITEIEMNYNEKFAEVHKAISNSQLQIQCSIAELGTRIERKFSELKIEQVKQQGDINLLKRDAT